MNSPQLYWAMSDSELKLDINNPEVYNRIKEEVKQIIRDEPERIVGDDNLKHLLLNKGTILS